MARDLIERHEGWTEWLETMDGETFTLVREADVEPVIDINKRRQNDNPKGMGPSREWQHIASVPPIIQLKWIEKYGADPFAKGNEGLLMRILNDPEWRYLRCSTVIV